MGAVRSARARKNLCRIEQRWKAWKRHVDSNPNFRTRSVTLTSMSLDGELITTIFNPPKTMPPIETYYNGNLIKNGPIEVHNSSV